MTQAEAKKSVKGWRKWAAKVRRRWSPDSPMYQLAERLEREAEERLTNHTASEQGEGC